MARPWLTGGECRDNVSALGARLDLTLRVYSSARHVAPFDIPSHKPIRISVSPSLRATVINVQL